MTRNTHTTRRRKALLSLLLFVLAVFAPILADTYLCPMAREAKARQASCCQAKAVQATVAVPGQSQLERSCDCPKLSWTDGLVDQSREQRSGMDPVSATVAALPLLALLPGTAPTHGLSESQTPRSSPSLWIRNQSIRC